ncbi:hypothetical protein EYF80_014894 [Liparis tanakae]|uniref:Uncharacterized protein n=1 Tax=Liparis tanakae TaxID=230148 RepID=A0A4Z2IBS2_9TELE|nr:hypothetical protein EYF80_014894 [Liparis tanakae]
MAAVQCRNNSRGKLARRLSAFAELLARRAPPARPPVHQDRMNRSGDRYGAGQPASAPTTPTAAGGGAHAAPFPTSLTVHSFVSLHQYCCPSTDQSVQREDSSSTPAFVFHPHAAFADNFPVY